jgi:mannose-6-phosphate isomerase-like protein (cupin superfamily)
MPRRVLEPARRDERGVRGDADMKRKDLRFGRGFRVAIGNARAQAAEMVLEPGKAEGGPRNRHRGADQWLYVVAGTGEARIKGRRYRLKPGTIMLIEHGDVHEVRNTGRSPLRTLNIYAPPAYRADGDELPPGRP